MYEVRLYCLAGTKTLEHNPLAWRTDYHDITWRKCETIAEALEVKRDVESGMKLGSGQYAYIVEEVTQCLE